MILSLLRRSGLVTGHIIADLGCGTGFFSLPAAEIVGDQGVVYAIDEVHEILQVLETKISEQGIRNVRTMESNLLATTIPNQSVDFVLMACVFHDLQRETLGAELNRILKPTGIICVVDWKKIATEHGPPIEVKLTEEDVIREMNDMGFTTSEVYEAGQQHYGIVSHKSPVSDHSFQDDK
uniref:Methyltransferase type 11 (UbiE) n=1 Tax=uncultured marine thaumarchaeote KM3_72_A09 TaxID=1456261 RepID=A0A075HHR6_9ARCH|nr:methyltransferase type 11 (ubiE) [uncultured marine thaumarchaeote KM3_72_A09]